MSADYQSALYIFVEQLLFSYIIIIMNGYEHRGEIYDAI
jgi:hypothetical protein